MADTTPATPQLAPAALTLWALLDDVRSRDARWLGEPLRQAHAALGAALQAHVQFALDGTREPFHVRTQLEGETPQDSVSAEFSFYHAPDATQEVLAAIGRSAVSALGELYALLGEDGQYAALQRLGEQIQHHHSPGGGPVHIVHKWDVPADPERPAGADHHEAGYYDAQPDYDAVPVPEPPGHPHGYTSPTFNEE